MNLLNPSFTPLISPLPWPAFSVGSDVHCSIKTLSPRSHSKWQQSFHSYWFGLGVKCMALEHSQSKWFTQDPKAWPHYHYSNKLSCQVTEAMMSPEIVRALWFTFYGVRDFFHNLLTPFLLWPHFFPLSGLSFSLRCPCESDNTLKIFHRLIQIASGRVLPVNRTVFKKKKKKSKSSASLGGIVYWVRILIGMALVWDLCVTSRGEQFG